jgi:hypothetical protein
VKSPLLHPETDATPLLDHGAVLSAFSIAEENRAKRLFSPLLINIAREGLSV